MKVNLYVHSDINSPTTNVWESFFVNYLPDWKYKLCFAEDILDGNPEIILFPGGSGSAFAKKLGKSKRNELIEWVSNGGCYIGVCAGAYLAASHLRITPMKIPDKAWERGLHMVHIEAVQNLKEGHHVVNYHNGPIFETHPDVEVWAWFKSNYLAEGGHYDMVDTPAITHNRFGNGYVTLFSPHLEKSDDHIKCILADNFRNIYKKIKQ
jgi:glutamine amidotransferase-like uncharacterized protein